MERTLDEWCFMTVTTSDRTQGQTEQSWKMVRHKEDRSKLFHLQQYQHPAERLKRITSARALLGSSSVTDSEQFITLHATREGHNGKGTRKKYVLISKKAKMKDPEFAKQLRQP